MGRDLDARGRRAAANLKAVMERTELTAVMPGTAKPRRPFFLALRPALIVGLLVVSSAVGVALVRDSDPPPPVVLDSTTTTSVATTTAPTTTTTPAPTTTVYVVPAPSTVGTVGADTEPPLLEITSPEDGAEFREKTLTFEGVTEPGARVFAGEHEAEVDAAGEWHIVLVLSEGSNVARFVARDAAGNESQAAVTVHYVFEKSVTTTTTTFKEELAAFAAYSQFGSCSESPPYDVYYGTGQPGSVVEITSEYGSGSVEVGEKGKWEKKVLFEGAPADRPFVVRVRDQFGREASFEFVYLP